MHEISGQKKDNRDKQICQERAATICQSAPSGQDYQNDIQWIIEAIIGDISLDIIPYVEEKLFASGALDVFSSQIIRYKGRPGIKLSILSTADRLKELEDILLLETSASSVHKYKVYKTMLARKTSKVITQYGPVIVKLSYLNDRILKYKAEYDDCKILANKYAVSLKEVYKEIERRMQAGEID